MKIIYIANENQNDNLEWHQRNCYFCNKLCSNGLCPVFESRTNPIIDKKTGLCNAFELSI